MKRRGATLSLAAALALLPAGFLPADGKFYFREEVPAKEPYQRALVAWKDGRQILVVQPHLLGKAEDFAWVLPVPAEPELGVLPSIDADEYFEYLADLSQPRLISLQPWVLLGIPVVALLVLLYNWRRIPRRHYLTILGGFLGYTVLCGFFTPTLLKSRGAPLEDDAVTVLSSQQLGIYSTQVVRSNRPGAMREWLAASGYRHAAVDEGAINTYEEKGWCFVASRLRATPTKVEAVNGMIDALVLTFPSPEPVYPFALTARYEDATLVLLYAFSDHKLAHPAMTLKFSGSCVLPPVGEPTTAGDFAHEISPACLVKLKGRLSKANVQGDLVLTRAADDTPYSAFAFRW